jgi:hypothetical protein
MPRSRRTRSFPVALAPVLLLGCGDHRLVAPAPLIEVANHGLWIEAPSLKLDIVFLVDNSLSMADKQDNLARNFPRFMRVLQDAVPAGDALDAHIAVVSSDLGIAPSGAAVEACGTTGGDDGVFQSRPRGACAGPRDPFIITNGAGQNFDGDVADVFSCIARLGTSGCGFEHQLGALRRALGGDPAAPLPPENVGFLRPDARLGVVLITDEDDCSAPAGSDLFSSDPAATAAYGPLDSYRCNEFGHLCGGAPPPRAAASGLTCEPNETATSRLVHVSEFVDFFRNLKPDPDLLRVAAIAGPATPYATHVASTAEGDVTRISPSCMGPAGAGDAAPGVRLKSFVDAFGDRGLYETICTDDFGPAMEHIAQTLVPALTPCVGARLFDRDPTLPGTQADCNVTETHLRAGEAPREEVVSSCDGSGGATPCWRLVADPRCAATADGRALVVDHGAVPPNADTRTRWSCRVCPSDDLGPGCVR